MDRTTDEHALEAAATYDSVVVPRYAQAFGDLLLQVVQIPERANVLDLACRTGYPSTDLLAVVGEGRIIAVDQDPAFLELARRRAGHEVGRRYFLKAENPEAMSFGRGVFSNAIGNLVDRVTNRRRALWAEAARVLRPDGQLVVTLPLAGSFSEVVDIFREVAQKHDLLPVAERVDRYALSLPSREGLQDEIEASGFVSGQTEQTTFTLSFESGGHLLSDPAMFFAALPEWQWCAAGIENASGVLYAVQSAIDVYFRGRPFDVTVVAGCAVAYRARK